MKAYCPNCGRYMVPVREHQQLLYMTCEPCEQALWQGETHEEAEFGPIQLLERPAISHKILEATSDDLLIIEPERGLVTEHVLPLLTVACVPLLGWLIWAMKLAGDGGSSLLLFLGIHATHVLGWLGWYRWLRRSQRFYMDRSEIVYEVVHGLRHRRKTIPLRELKQVTAAMARNQDGENTFELKLDRTNGTSLACFGKLPAAEAKWLAQAIRRWLRDQKAMGLIDAQMPHPDKFREPQTPNRQIRP